MGNQLSSFGDVASSTATANDLYVKETALKGLQVVGAVGTCILLSPVIIVALPFVGAYEFGAALESELLSGYKVIDGIIGGLFGVVASPLAPFYCFLVSMQEIFNTNKDQRHIASQKYMNKAQGMLKLDPTYYNIVITGCPGTGKSTLLNGLLGYKDNHKNAAKVGEIETTLEPKSYRHPILNTVYLWDMPGVGTPRHPSKNYFERYFLGAFDAILIVFDDRLMASDVDIARQAKIYKVPVFFIKNKADMSIDRKMQRMREKNQATAAGDVADTLAETKRWALAVSDLTAEVKSTIYKNMRRLSLNTDQLYIVSANTLRDFVIMLMRDQSQSISVKSSDIKNLSLGLIHEKILISNLMDTLANREHNNKCCSNMELGKDKCSTR